MGCQLSDLGYDMSRPDLARWRAKRALRRHIRQGRTSPALVVEATFPRLRGRLPAKGWEALVVNINGREAVTLHQLHRGPYVLDLPLPRAIVEIVVSGSREYSQEFPTDGEPPARWLRVRPPRRAQSVAGFSLQCLDA